MRPFPLPGKDIPNWDAIKAMILQLDPGDDEAERSIRQGIERRAERDLSRALADQAAAVTASDLNSVSEAVGRAAEHNPTVRDVLRRMLQASADLGVSVAVSQFEGIGFGFDWTLANQAAAEWVNRYTFELVSGIENTTQRRLQTAVSEWISNGDPLDQLARELAPVFGRDRAQLIASTEVTRAYAEANRIAYGETGVVDRVEWRTAEDERVCPICGPLDRQTADRNDGFDDVGFPPAHPRCRCWIVPVIDDILTAESERIAEELLPIFASRDEALAWAKDNKFANQIDFGKLDLESINEMMSSLDAHYKMLPVLKGKINFVGSAQAANTNLLQHVITTARADAEAQGLVGDQITRYVDIIKKKYKPFVGKIPDAHYAFIEQRVLPGTRTLEMNMVMNEKWGKQSSKLIKSLEDTVASGMHPTGVTTVRSVFDHELGHVVDDILKVSQSDAFVSIYRTASGLPGGIAENVSIYATNNQSEFIAEAWAEFLNNPNPRPIAKSVGNLILEMAK